MKISILNKVSTLFKKILIILFWLIMWEIIALIINKSIYLPTPFSVFKTIYSLLIDINTYKIIIASSIRTIIGIFLSTLFGISLGIICGLKNYFYEIFNPLITVLRSTPIVSIIILAIIMLKSSNVPIFAAFLMCFPIIFTNTYSGIKAADKDILEMCKLYKVKTFHMLKPIYLHYAMPNIYAAIISCSGIAWKACTAAEVLSMPNLSIGKYLFYAKAHLEIESLFSWTIIIIALSYIFEKILEKIFRYDRYDKIKTK